MEFIGKNNLDGTRRMVVEWRAEPKKHAMSVLNFTDDREGGITPLIKAAVVGNVEICKCLLAESLVLYNKQDADFKSPLCHACERSSAAHIFIVKLLLAKEGPEEGERTILDRALPLAVKANNIEAVKLLIAAGADLNETDKYGFTPLARSVSMSHSNMAALLIKQDDVEVNQQNKYGTTPLHYAALQGNKGMVEMLLRRPDLLLNKGDKKGQTPLRVAVGDDVRRLLQSRGGTEEANCTAACIVA